MNRRSVGMIFEFLHPDEKLELQKLKPEEREYLDYADSEDPDNHDLVWIQDSDEINPAMAYRPKGFLSWHEIETDLNAMAGRKFLVNNELWVLVGFSRPFGSEEPAVYAVDAENRKAMYRVYPDLPDYGLTFDGI